MVAPGWRKIGGVCRSREAVEHICAQQAAQAVEADPAGADAPVGADEPIGACTGLVYSELRV